MVSQYVPYTIKFFEECMQLQQIKHGNSLIHRLTPGKPKLTPIIYFTNMISVSPVTQSKGDTFSVVIDYKTERNFLKLQIRTDQTSAIAIKDILAYHRVPLSTQEQFALRNASRRRSVFF